MKRKLVLFFAFIFLLSQLLLTGYAGGITAPQVEIKAAYWQNETLYSFVHFESPELAAQGASLLVNNQKTREVKPVKMTDADAVAHYMLLVDVSNSMGWCRNLVLSFAQSLMEQNENIKISIGKFDRTFSPVSDDLTDWEAVKASLQSLTYYKDGSDINGSVAAAIEYLGSSGYDSGEFTNLVVLTDGEPWYTNDGYLEEKLEQEANQKLTALMQAYPEIMVHTLSFVQWRERTYEPYTNSNGLNMVQWPMEEAAAALTEFADSLHAVFFPLEGYQTFAQIPDDLLLCVGMNFNSYQNVRNTGVTPALEVDTSQDDLPEETLAPSEPDATEAASSGAYATEAAEMPAADVPDVTEAANAEQSAEDTDDDKKASVPTAVTIAAVGIAVAVLAVIVLAAVAKKRRIRNQSVRMRVSVLSGENIRVKDTYYLFDEILIGAGKKCDIIIPGDNAVSCRIFKQDQMIYIEDLGTREGTALNGMRIFAPNRLRSADEIAVGSVVLQVWF